jgi:type VI secretion system ImpC/EvpB family protein
MDAKSALNGPAVSDPSRAENPAQAGLIAPGSSRRQGLGVDLLDQCLNNRSAPLADGEGRSTVDRFLQEPSFGHALVDWLGLTERSTRVPAKDQIIERLSRDIARIDALVAGQLDAVLHHPRFQRLEASWRGLEYLTGKLPDNDSVKIRVLNVSWNELVQDQTRALEFDQSQLFRKVYESEFGHPGGEPFGLLLGDYEIRHRPSAEHPFDDVETLSGISSVAAAAFAPFIAGVHPSFFGLESFTELERSINLPRIFEHIEYLKWRALRQTEDARFVGLTLPRVLWRLPYRALDGRKQKLLFREDVAGQDRARYLWGNAVYAFGGVVIRCFNQSGWLAAIRGVRQASGAQGGRVLLDEGGLVDGLPVHSHGTDRAGLATKCSTDVIITDAEEKALGELGFIPLCHCQDTPFSAFYGNQSIQKPAKYNDPKATANAQLSAMLQYTLCVSRFAHYIKVLGREYLGAMMSPEAIEGKLKKWLQQYVTGNDAAGPELKAKYPLREAAVQVREGQPGHLTCTVHLRPHCQLDKMYMSVKLVTELAPPRSS